jgi:uncharacterized protein
MAIDITPKLIAGRQLIQGYGGGGFTVGGSRYQGGVLVFPHRILAWPVPSVSNLTLASLGPVIEVAAEVQILVVGCGKRFEPPPQSLVAELRRSGIGVEWMDTGAACRTFNVLLLEDRSVAAALIAVD